MRTAVTLESKEIRLMIAWFLGLPLEAVVPQRYGFSVTGLSEAEIARKIEAAKAGRDA